MKQTKAQIELALAKRLARYLGCRMRVAPKHNAYRMYDVRSKDLVSYLSCNHPIFGDRMGYVGLVDLQRRYDLQSLYQRLKWLSKKTSLAEIDLRLTAMGF